MKTTSKITDQELVDAIRSDNQTVITEYVNLNLDEIMRYVTRFCQDPSLYRSIAIKSFTTLYVKIKDKKKPILVSAIAFWKTIAKGEASNHYRKFKSFDEIDDNMEHDDIGVNSISYEEESRQNVVYDFVIRKLKQLSEKCYKLLIARYWDHSTYKELAADWNISEVNLRSDVRRCKDALRPIIDERDYKWIFEE